MHDLVLIKKMSREEISRNSVMGRPKRTAFALRHYAGGCILAIPYDLIIDGDSADFFMSAMGFAVQISSLGTRAISGRKNTRTVSVPIIVSAAIPDVPYGTHELIAEEMPDRMWFFRFDQLPKQ
jgi:hypothetical protein